MFTVHSLEVGTKSCDIGAMGSITSEGTRSQCLFGCNVLNNLSQWVIDKAITYSGMLFSFILVFYSCTVQPQFCVNVFHMVVCSYII